MSHEPHPAHPSPLTSAPPAEPLRRHAAVLLGYLALALAVTWPLALDLQGAAVQLYAEPVDAGQGIWNLWWTRAALLRGWNPYLTDYIYFPLRVNLFFQTLSLPNGISALPVLLPFGPVAAFNAVGLLSFALGGYLAYRLARGLVGVVAALAAGFVFAFSAFHLQIVLVGAMEVIAIHWIPLYVLALMRALRRPTLARWLAAGSVLVITTLASSYYGLFLAVYTAGHAALALPGSRPAALPIVRGLVLLYAVWAGVLLLFTGPPGRLDETLMGDWYRRQVFQAAALVDYLAPNTLHPLWGDRAARWLSRLSPAGVESGAALGYSVYALMALGLARRWRMAWPWGALALLAFLCSLGPELKLAADPIGLPLPYALLDLLGPFRNSTRPNYWVGVLMLPASVLVGLGVQALADRRPEADDRPAAARRWYAPSLSPTLRRRSFVAGRWSLLALLLFELWPRPLPLLRIEAGPLYAGLARDEAPGGVLELPPRTNDSRAMLNQLCHGRPLAGGYLARTPDYPPVNGASAMRRLWTGDPAQPDIFGHDPAGELATLGVRFVVLNLDQMSGGRAGRLRELLAAPGVGLAANAEAREVYAVDPAQARPFAVPTDGWYAPETDGARAWRWIGSSAGLRLHASAPSYVALTITATAFGRDRPLTLALDGLPVGSYTIPAAPADHTVRLRLLLPAGAHRLALVSEGEPAPDGRTLSLSIARLQLAGGPLPPEAGQLVAGRPPTLPRPPGVSCGA